MSRDAANAEGTALIVQAKWRAASVSCKLGTLVLVMCSGKADSAGSAARVTVTVKCANVMVKLCVGHWQHVREESSNVKCSKVK